MSDMIMDLQNQNPIRATKAVCYRLDAYLRKLSPRDYVEVQKELFKFFEEYDPERQKELDYLREAYLKLINQTVSPPVFLKMEGE